MAGGTEEGRRKGRKEEGNKEGKGRGKKEGRKEGRKGDRKGARHEEWKSVPTSESLPFTSTGVGRCLDPKNSVDPPLPSLRIILGRQLGVVKVLKRVRLGPQIRDQPDDQRRKKKNVATCGKSLVQVFVSR